MKNRAYEAVAKSRLFRDMIAVLFLVAFVTSFNYGGCNTPSGGGSSGGSSTPAPDTTPPSVPTGLNASAVSSSQINLTWNASSDAVGVTGYKVYRNGSYVGPSSTTSYNNTGLSPSTTYNYTVSAYDAAGNNSAQSSQASATTGSSSDTIAPTIPTGLAANAASSSQINLTWNASSDAVGVTGYKVYRNGSYVGPSSTTSYNNTGLSPSTTYNYTVSAYDAAGNTSAQSSQASATTSGGGGGGDTIAPTVPTGLTANATSSSQINLVWNPSTDNVGVSGYKIYRNGTYLTSVAGTSYNNTGLSSSTTYNYTVAAYDAAGNTSAQSSQASATTQSPPVTPPAQVGTSGRTPTNGATGVSANYTTTMYWAAASGATSYDVYFGFSNPPDYAINTPDTSYNFGTLGWSTQYFWRIDSRNSAGPTTGIVWNFTTEANPDTTPPYVVSVSPANGATGVSINPSISVTFSEAMNEARTEQAFDFSRSGTTRTFSWSGNTMTVYIASPDLYYYTYYSWGIATYDARDLAGNSMQNEYVAGFTTAPESGTSTFNYTGGQQTWTVPSGVTSITVDVRGAQGGKCSAYSAIGGKGARVQTTLSVTPGQTLYIYVGGQGSGKTGGYNGGGVGWGIAPYDGAGGGGGGGASDIRLTSNTTYQDRAVVAGGGGGSAGNSNYNGGAAGQNGTNGSGSVSTMGGRGATQSSGGSGGTGDYPGGSGSFGNGGGSSTGGGGGGGGGTYGGGGGSGINGSGFGSGGGGSSWGQAGATFTSGYQSGNGKITITY